MFISARRDAITSILSLLVSNIVSSTFSWSSRLFLPLFLQGTCFLFRPCHITASLYFIQNLLNVAHGRQYSALRNNSAHCSKCSRYKSTLTPSSGTFTFGGTRYIATGHGFATAPIYFRILFSRFTDFDVVDAVSHLPLVTVMSLCIAPFWFNPHQFVFLDFVIDYQYVHFSCIFNQVLT